MQDSSTFTPQLTTQDWGDEWVLLQKARRAADNSEYWNERSKTYKKSDSPNDYVKHFIKLANILPGETVFDMGCGNGAITIPLAMEGHSVIAADFSRGMLDALCDEASKHAGLDIQTKLMSWEDDWEAMGVGENCVDVACASRSIITADMRDSLARLSRAARKRCCITLTTGASPRVNERIIEAIGLKQALGHDYLYAFVMLANMGYLPEVSYIYSRRNSTYSSQDDAYESLRKMTLDACGTRIPKAQVDDALVRLREWTSAHLIANPEAGMRDARGEAQQDFRLDIDHIINWAFISWNTQKLSKR